MAAEFDATDFVDEDFQKSRQGPAPAPAAGAPVGESRALTREEVEARLTELQGRLANLKREQGEIERERSAFEETRRRQIEFTTGREELIRDLSRGIQLLEEKELGTRRDAEQMAQHLKDLKENLAKLQSIQEAAWSRESLSSELSRAMGLVDHARMEWNTARLKFPILSLNPQAQAESAPDNSPGLTPGNWSFRELARLGLALNWPVVAAALIILLVLLLRR